jgi:hypothetical protein
MQDLTDYFDEGFVRVIQNVLMRALILSFDSALLQLKVVS